MQRLYAIIDQRTARLSEIHADRLHCGRGCSSCCVDELTVFEVEALNIQQHNTELLAHGTPHPPGACAFLDDAGSCRIYAQRPYVCRTQGLPLRWLDEDDEGQTYELRDICPLNEAGMPVEELAAEECWTLGPAEELLAQRQAIRDGGQMRRIALRSLFKK